MLLLMSKVRSTIQKFDFGNLRVRGEVGQHASVSIGDNTFSQSDSLPRHFEFKVDGFNRNQVEAFRLYLGLDGRLCIICQWPCKVGGWMGFNTKTVYVSGWSLPLAYDQALTLETEPVFKSDTRYQLEVAAATLAISAFLGVSLYLVSCLF